MMNVRGINRMVQRNKEGNVCRQCAQLPDEPFGLQSPRSQLETRNPVQLNQWVTATLRGTDCSENSTDRLFPQPARLPGKAGKPFGEKNDEPSSTFVSRTTLLCAATPTGSSRRRRRRVRLVLASHCEAPLSFDN